MPRQMRVRVADDGRLEIVDPGFDALPLLRAIDPRYSIVSEPLPGFEAPRFQRARRVGSGLALQALAGQPTDLLWAAHGTAGKSSGLGVARSSVAPNEASLLDLKAELAERLLAACCLCGHRCGSNRLAGKRGKCGLGAEAIVGEALVHIAEEPPINPSLVLNLIGCGLRCRHCQQSTLLEAAQVGGVALDSRLWPQLDARGARSMSFAGGNPDESLAGVLGFLRWVPSDWSLPIVWNCHSYASPETLTLLDGVVDAYVPDVKYGNDECGERLSGVPHYALVSRAAASAMVGQRVPVIVRVLVLPGHFRCCHEPVLRFLATLPERENLVVSIRGQYCPGFRIGPEDGEMCRRPSEEEVWAVRELAAGLGLRMVL